MNSEQIQNHIEQVYETVLSRKVTGEANSVLKSPMLDLTVVKGFTDNLGFSKSMGTYFTQLQVYGHLFYTITSLLKYLPNAYIFSIY